MSEKKAREAWDTLRYHFQPTDIPAMQPEDLEWPPTVEQVRLIFRTIAARVHPDRGGPAHVFRDVSEARVALVGYLEAASPRPRPTSGPKTPCDACNGTGAIRLPSRTLGGQGLRKKCSACDGSGVTCP